MDKSTQTFLIMAALVVVGFLAVALVRGRRDRGPQAGGPDIGPDAGRPSVAPSTARSILLLTMILSLLATALWVLLVSASRAVRDYEVSILALPGIMTFLTAVVAGGFAAVLGRLEARR